VDGDTIKVDIAGTVYSVRYIGIDCPEVSQDGGAYDWMALEATEANRRLVEGQVVYLEKDVSETDRYGRLLRYVYLPAGLLVNAELVRLGYAQASTYPPDVHYQALFVDVQREAQAADRGLWGPTPVPTLTASALSAYASWFRRCTASWRATSVGKKTWSGRLAYASSPGTVGWGSKTWPSRFRRGRNQWASSVPSL
jgi:endonuclease YncB( thermonuclease family)